MKQRAGNPKSQTFLHYVSKTGTFMFLYGFIYILFQYTLGIMSFIKEGKIFEQIPISVPIFSLLTIVVIWRFIRISSPYAQK